MKLFILAWILLTLTKCFSQTPKKAEVISLNGANVYYEVYGIGEPLFLLHGYTQSSKYWLPYLSDYINDFEVYLIDLRGHGKSGPFKENLSIAAANDVDALARYLKLDSIKAIGYSYGGDVLFQLAVLHPTLVKSMITIGSCGRWNAKDYPDWLEDLSYKNIGNLKWMQEYQVNEAQSKIILEQFPNYNVYISDQEMKNIQAKTLIVLGDQDNSIPLDCVSQTRKNLSDSYLWILPFSHHGAHEGKNKKEFIRVSKEFFSDSFSK
jgi:pimeloyl-ACP methyl ester carboxylesterase